MGGDRGRRGGGHARGPARQPRAGGRRRLAEAATLSSRPRRHLRAFWQRTYRENLTGMAAMVAYNLALAIFPFVLLLLFVFGQVIENAEIRESVLRDLEALFPAAEHDSLQEVLDRIRQRSTTIGIAAAIGALWIGASFWGAMDTAFCRIYHVPCRGWLEQKRFALAMLLVVTLFLVASVAIPLAQGILASGADELPFGLDEFRGLRNVALLAIALALTFGICCLIYYTVPRGHVPWCGVWPGAAFVTATTAVANAVFPFYLAHSSIDRLGGALGFILIALLWFYLISLVLLAGAVINALRYELRATGRVAERPDGEPGAQP